MREVTKIVGRARADRMAPHASKVRAAILRWWKGARPVAWTVAQHVANPHVNLSTKRERDLADIAAALTRETSKARRGSMCPSWPRCACIVRGTVDDCPPRLFW